LTRMSADHLVECLSGADTDRLIAYEALCTMLASSRESPSPPPAAVRACMSPLCGVLCKEVAEVGVDEFRRVSLLLAELMCVFDHGTGGATLAAELVRLPQCGMNDVWRAPGSALGQVKAKDPAALSVEDVHTIGHWMATTAQVWAMWDQAFEVAGSDGPKWCEGYFSACFLLVTSNPSDDQTTNIVTIALELLRRPDDIPAFALGGLVEVVTHSFVGRPAVGAHALQHGALECILEYLQRTEPADWVNRRTYGLGGNNMIAALGDLVEALETVGSGVSTSLALRCLDCIRPCAVCSCHEIRRARRGQVDLSARLLSSGCVDRMVATLNAAAQLGMEWLTGRPVVWTLRALSSIHGEQAAAIEDKLRAVAAPALRWLLDPSRDVSFGKFLGWTAGSFGTALAANLYGREEGGADAQFVFLVEHLHNLVRSTYHLHDTSNLIKALEVAETYLCSVVPVLILVSRSR
jgi:hypothetical protein